MNFLHVITCGLLLAAVPPVGDGGTGESDIEIQTMCLNNETFNLPLDSFGIDGNGRLLALSCVAMLLVTALFLYKAERTVVNKLKSDFVKMWQMKGEADVKMNELSASLDKTQNTLSSTQRKLSDAESKHAVQSKQMKQEINQLKQKNISLQAQYDSEKKRADLTENSCKRAQKAMTEMENNLLSTQRLKDNAEAKANELSASLNQTQNTLSSAERKLEEMESRHAAREANWLQTIYDFAQELVSTQSKADEQVAKMTLELRDSKVDSEELTKMKTKLEAEKKRKKKTQKKMNRMLKEHLRTQGQKEKAEVKVRELTTALIKSQIKLSYKQRRQCAISQMKDTENQLTEVQTPLLEAKDSALATESQQVAVENDIKMKLEIKEPVKSVKRKNRKKLVPYDIYKLNKEESNLIQCWWELSN